MMNILCLGASYTGRYGALYYPNRKQYNVYFLSRAMRGDRLLNYFPIEALQANNRHSTQALPSIDCIVNTVPPYYNQNLELELAYRSVVRQIMQRQSIYLYSHEAEAIPYIYISSTAVFPEAERGVEEASVKRGQNTNATRSMEAEASKSGCKSGYGRHNEKLPIYNEASLATPNTLRGQRRFAAEELVRRTYPHAKILRSTGIYGRGRSIVEQFRKGNYSRVKLGNLWVSRIHVEDLWRLILALASRKDTLPLVHAVDEGSAPYYELFKFMRSELGINIPKFLESDEKLNAVRGRIIQSLYAKDLLDGAYSYPSYKSGFRDLAK